MKLQLIALSLVFSLAAVVSYGDPVPDFTAEHMEKCADVCLKVMRDRLPKEQYERLQSFKLTRKRNSADFEATYVKKVGDEPKDWGKYERNCHLHGASDLHCDVH